MALVRLLGNRGMSDPSVLSQSPATMPGAAPKIGFVSLVCL